MNSFTISQLQEYSGIKAHTIRVWEQRYNALSPSRTDGNTRFYNGDQLRRLLNITSLLTKNLKISYLAGLEDSALNQLIDEHFLIEDNHIGDAELFISQLLSATFDFDEARFEKLFSNCILRFGLKDTYLNVLHPTLLRLGLLWSKDSLPPAHEHFIVNLIRKKILSAIAALPPAVSNDNSWVLYLPEDEFHDTGLLMAYFLIRSTGKKVYYLGANVPLDSLKQSMEIIKPTSALGFLVGKKNKNKTLTLINRLSKDLQSINFVYACNWEKTDKTGDIENFHKISSIVELEALLA